jgi:hypothetical protein
MFTTKEQKPFNLADAIADVRMRRTPHEQRKARLADADARFQAARYANGGHISSTVTDEAAVQMLKEDAAIAEIGRAVFAGSGIDVEIEARFRELAERWRDAVAAADDFRALVHQRAMLARECGVSPPALPGLPDTLSRSAFEDWRQRTERIAAPRPAAATAPARRRVPLPDFAQI